MPVKKDVIVTWLKRIQSSELSVSQFLAQYTVPFSRPPVLACRLVFFKYWIMNFNVFWSPKL